MITRLKPKIVIKIGERYFRLRNIDSGFQHAEDKGLWRADLVEWDYKYGRFTCNDDDDWIISSDGTKVIAKETGWNLRRYVNGTYWLNI